MHRKQCLVSNIFIKRMFHYCIQKNATFVVRDVSGFISSDFIPTATARGPAQFVTNSDACPESRRSGLRSG